MPIHRFQFRLRTLLLVVAVLSICCFVANALMFRSGESVINNALVGRFEGEIVAAYGQPNVDQPSYLQLGLRPPAAPPMPSRTLIFEHTNGGTLWVWMTKRGAAWQCFESCWFADGVVF